MRQSGELSRHNDHQIPQDIVEAAVAVGLVERRRGLARLVFGQYRGGPMWYAGRTHSRDETIPEPTAQELILRARRPL